MGCNSSKDEDIRASKQRETRPQTEGARPGGDASEAAAADDRVRRPSASMGPSAPRGIGIERPDGAGQGGSASSATADGMEAYSTSIDARNLEQQWFQQIVRTADDDFIDVGQTGLDLDMDEPAPVDEGMLVCREHLREVALPKGVVASGRLPRRKPMEPDLLYRLLSAPPMSAGKNESTRRAAEQLVSAAQGMAVQEPTQSIVVTFSMAAHE
mmetsp:Transcript_58516/g.161905  ORF Transcript_58516/g.161905 Transcript_58516/m.161905 type:complete len:213 (+) Transcript_58516:85-723(+)